MGKEEMKEELFVEAKGLPANEHAKKLAKGKKKAAPAGTFYTVSGEKVLKKIVKGGKVFSVFIGNKRKHKDVMDPAIEGWKKQGVWCESHQAEAKIEELKKQIK